VEGSSLKGVAKRQSLSPPGMQLQRCPNAHLLPLPSPASLLHTSAPAGSPGSSQSPPSGRRAPRGRGLPARCPGTLQGGEAEWGGGRTSELERRETGAVAAASPSLTEASSMPHPPPHPRTCRLAASRAGLPRSRQPLPASPHLSLPLHTHPPANFSTAVKVRWMGEAVPGRVVNRRRQRPSSSGLAVGACGRGGRAGRQREGVSWRRIP
jgi:hypothetical protein